LAVIGGLVTSTIMSLLVIPCVFEIFDGLKDRFRKDRWNEIEANEIESVH
jgi:hydrophobic/amphiphilic exporter-1 (mainly G- bacteria), HAE1 family